MPPKQLTLAAVLLVVALLPAAIELSHVRQAEAAPGDHLWSKRFGDAMGQVGAEVATDAAGNVFLTGYFLGSVDFGGGALTSAGDSDIFLAKFGDLSSGVGGIAELPAVSALPAAASSSDRIAVVYALGVALLAALVISGGGLYLRSRRRVWH